MKKHLHLAFALTLMFGKISYSQCTYTAAITANSSTLGCGDRILTASPSGNLWTQKTSFGGVTRQYASSFSIGAKGYIGTGLNSSNTSLADFWEFDPATNAWTQKANFAGGARYAAVGFNIGTKGYIGTGYSNTYPYYMNDFWEYDPSANVWAQKASFSGAGRYLATGFTIGAKGYIGTGTGNSNYNDFWEFDPSLNFWSQKANFGGGYRYGAVGISINAKGYIGSGNGGYNDFWEFDPSLNFWTQKTNFNTTGLYGATAFTIGSKGYLFGGYDASTSVISDKLLMFDPSTNAWTQMPAIGTANGRAYATAFAIGSKGYVGTGYYSGPLATFWEFEPLGSYAWSTGAITQSVSVSSSGSYSVLVTTAGGCTATATQSLSLSPNPTISVSGGTNVLCAGSANTLVAGGASTYTWSANAGSSNSSSVILTPTSSTTYTLSGTTGTCTVNYPIVLSVNPVPVASISASGATLNCGTVTLTTNAGGNTWTQKTGLNIGREYGVGFSIGSKGYVGTGYNGNSYPYYYSDFWEYDPGTNAWTQKANFGGGVRQSAVGFSIGSKGYVGTGYNNNVYPYYTNDFWEYDPAANTWTQKANFAGSTRTSAAGFSINNKGYIGTGYSQNYPYLMADFYEYDPSNNTWTQKTAFGGVARQNAAAFSIGNKGYLGAGGVNNSPYYASDFWEYDPSNNTWVQKTNFPGGNIQAMAAFSLGNRGYVGTGELSTSVQTNIFYEFNPTANTWTQKAAFGGAARSYANGFAIGDKGYIGLGNSPTSPYYMNDLWQYDPSTTILWSTGATLQAIPVSASGSYSVTVSNLAGCSASAVQSLSLSPNPTLSVSGGTNVLCAGSSNTLVASGASTYTWSANAGSSNSSSVTLSPTVSTTYTLSGTTGTCTVNYPISINVNAVPVATIAASGPTLNCGTVTLSTGAGGNTWTQKAGLNIGRQNGVAFSIGTKGYIGTGYNNNSSPYVFQDFWEYDPSTNAWTQKANFAGGARQNAVGFSIGAKGYIGTGYSNSYPYYLNDFWEYDPSTNTWTQKTSFGGTIRMGATGFGLGSKGYIGTGYNGNTYPYYLNDFWEYDQATNTWTQKTSFGGVARQYAVSFAIGTKGYLGTGNISAYPYYSSDFWEYDPTANTWTQKTSYSGGLVQGASGFSIGSKGYIGTGELSTSSYTTGFWEYSPTANTWTQKANFGGVSRTLGSAFSIGNKGYMGIGYYASSPYFMNDIWEYEQSTSIVWSTGSTLQAIPVSTSGSYSVTITNVSGCSASSAQSLSLSPNPTLSISGGSVSCAGISNTLTGSGATTYTWSSNAGSSNSSSVIVTPSVSTTYTLSGSTGSCTVNYPVLLNVNAVPVASISASGPTVNCGTVTLTTLAGGNTWTQKGGLNIGRQNAVGFSIGSKGYIGTGFNGNTSPYYLNDFWEFDPITNAWTQKANFAGVGRQYATGFSVGSKGYIGMGNNGNIYPYVFNDFWEYDPAINTWTQKASLAGFPRYSAVGFGIGSKGYIGTGYNANTGYYTNDFWEYDPSTNLWTQKTNFGGIARMSAAAFTIGAKGYIGTGYTNSYASDFWEYDPSANLWTQKAAFAGGAAQEVTGFSLGNRGYFTTGELNSGLSTNILYEYNPTANTWAQKANFGGTARTNAASFAIGNVGYVGTGYSSGSPYYMNDLWQYDPSTTILWSTGSTVQAIPVSTSGSYSVTISNLAGCSATASQSLALSPNPTISVNGGNSVLCAGLSSTLTGNGATTYTWSTNAGSGNSSSIVVTPTTSTIYTLSGTTGTCTVNYPVQIIVNPTPASSIISIGSTTICGTAITLSAGVAPGNTWTQKTGLNSGRSMGVGFSIGSKGYMGTGYSNNFPYYFDDMWEYDASTNAWTQKASFAGGTRYTAVAFVIGSKAYVGTGFDPNLGVKNDFWEFDPAANTWIQKANFGGTPRRYATGFAIGTKGYLGTGYDNTNSYKNDFWEYDPSTDAWTAKANAGTYTRYQAAGFSIGAKGYIASGYSPSLGNATDVWEYDPTTNFWTSKASIGGTGRYGAAVFVLGSKAYITGGNTSTDCWEYTQSSNTWVQKTAFGGTYRYNASAFSVGGKGYVCTGAVGTSTYYNDLWEYDLGVTYLWSNSAATQTISATTSGTYSLTVSNFYGCASTSSQALSITPSPVVTITGANSICSGTNISLTANGATTYTWGATASNSVSSVVNVTPTANTSYVVTGATNGCTTTATKLITVNALPPVTANATNPSVCDGSTVTLYGGGASSYTWTSGIINNAVFIPTSNASYTVTGTDANGCKNTAVVSLTVKPSPTVSVNSGSICAGQTFTINPTGAISYAYSGGASVVSPNATTSYTVTGYNAVGCSNAIPAISSVSVYAIPVVTVASGVVCQGSSYTIVPSGAASYVYSSGSNVVTPTSNTSYSVTGTSSVGCVSAVPAVVNVTVSALPTIGVNSGTLCNGQTFSLSPYGAVNYTYSSGSATVNPSTSTSYTITGANQYGCQAVAAAIANLTVLVSPTVTVNSGTICAGDPFIINPTGAINYVYSGGSATVSPATTTSYTITGTNGNGCPNASPAISTVSVFALPTLTANNGTICLGKSFTISPNGAASYTFSSISPVVTPSINSFYSVTGSSSVGCLSSNTLVVNVVVNPLPTVSVNNGTICSGKTFTLSPSGAISYTFSGGSAIVTPSATTSYSVTGVNSFGCENASPAISQVSVLTTPTIALTPVAYICTGNSYTINPTGAANYTYSGGTNIVTPSGSTNYTVTGVSPDGCYGTAVITVSVQPSLTVSISGPTVACEGQVITLTGNGANSYTWSTGATSNTILVSSSTATVYTVNAGNGNCAGSATQNVGINLNPTLNIQITDSVICANETTTINVSGANTYSWSEGSLTPFILVAPASTTTYSVVGTDGNGCSSSAVVTQSVSDCTGLSKLENVITSIRVYPNPSNSFVNIELSSLPENSVVEVYNYIGQLILSEKIINSHSQLNLGNAANGMYTLKVSSNGKNIATAKIIKQ